MTQKTGHKRLLERFREAKKNAIQEPEPKFEPEKWFPNEKITPYKRRLLEAVQRCRRNILQKNIPPDSKDIGMLLDYLGRERMKELRKAYRSRTSKKIKGQGVLIK